MFKKLVSTMLAMAIFLSSACFCSNLFTHTVAKAEYIPHTLAFSLDAPVETGENDTFLVDVNVHIPDNTRVDGLELSLDFYSFYLDCRKESVVINSELSGAAITFDYGGGINIINFLYDGNLETKLTPGNHQLFSVEFTIQEEAIEHEVEFNLNVQDAYYMEPNGDGSWTEKDFDVNLSEAIASVWIGERFKLSNDIITIDLGESVPITWNKAVSPQEIINTNEEVCSFEYGTTLGGKITGLTVGTSTLSITTIGTNETVFLLVNVIEPDTSLKEMTILNAEISPEFDPERLSYTANVPYSIDKLIIFAEANVTERRAVIIENNNLVSGETTCVTITVKTTNPSGIDTTTVYSINVYRGLPSQDSSLKSLSASNATLSPEFNPSTFYYTATVPYEAEKLNLTAVQGYDKATVKIENPSLKVGDVTPVTVTVTAEDGQSSSVYCIDVTRERRVYPEKISSSQYTVGSTYISKIAAGTTVSQLLNGMNDWQYIQIRRANGVVATATETVKTGFTVCLMHGSTLKQSLTVVVTGDANGDGKITASDYVNVKFDVLGKTKLNGAYSVAADINGDGKITATDYVNIKFHVLNKSSIKPR